MWYTRIANSSPYFMGETQGQINSKLALRGEFLPQQAWEQIEALTNKLVDSKALPSSIVNAPQLMMVFLAGYEAGMSPMQSLSSYYIVSGKVTIYGDAVMRQLKLAGYKVRWGEVTEKSATVTIIAADGDTHSESFTWEDAVTAKLTSKDNWIKYPKDQLRWKALGRAVRFFCPEVTGGFYMKEEAQDFDDNKMPKRGAKKDYIDVDVTPEAPAQPPAAEIDETKAPVGEVQPPEDKPQAQVFGECEVCGKGHYIIRTHPKGGEFLACNQYPACKSMKPLPANSIDAAAKKGAENIAAG